MGFNQCDNCGGAISWDKQRREALGTKRPLNHDGTIHSCGGNGMRQQLVQQKPTNPIQKTVIDQDQKSKDIKAAQLERKKEHDELMIELRNLRKAIVAEIASRKDAEAQDIIDSIGFEESRQDQQESFMDDVV
jgi:hypothetical protein